MGTTLMNLAQWLIKVNNPYQLSQINPSQTQINPLQTENRILFGIWYIIKDIKSKLNV